MEIAYKIMEGLWTKQLDIDDELIMFKNPTVYSKPIAILKKGRLVKIIKCENEWCKGKSERNSCYQGI